MFSVARTAQGDKAVSGELQIGDVCARCNNERLSTLDAYICEMHDRYFKTLVHAGDRIVFRFDFDSLLRWLLKTGYNVARARGGGIKRDSEFASYVIGQRERPAGFRLFLQLIIPTPTDSRKWAKRPDADEIPPASARIDFLDVSRLIGFNIAFQLSLNSYLFHIFKEDQRVPARIRKTVLRNLIKQMPGASEITNKQRQVIHASSLDFMTLVEGNRVFARQVEMMKRHRDSLRKRNDLKDTTT